MNNRIIICDDDQRITRFCHKILTPKFDVTVCYDGESCIKLVERSVRGNQLFALVFVDVLLPGKDGYSVVRDLQKIDENLRIVLITASVIKSLPEFRFPSKVLFLAKPFTAVEICQLAISLTTAYNLEETILLNRDELIRGIEVTTNSLLKVLEYERFARDREVAGDIETTSASNGREDEGGDQTP